MANNVILGNRRGLNNLIDQWLRYATYFENIELQLAYVTKLSDKVSCAYATLNTTITDTTVSNVFPHIANVDKSFVTSDSVIGNVLCRKNDS
ncbi:hypothetical protein PHMEG_00032339 [Phytophthora megakarya]|uniref:Uncharacterized protein n=1 Tax=Phytophthora megakarya TaxID=4795 RepID=A0A225UVX7_9STRA|nr:hypothetical protein PHMEG_00032339 [Phytophthora megakarya]